MRFVKQALCVLLLFTLLSCAVAPGEIRAVSPSSLLVHSGDKVSLGTIGPGQTVSFLADPEVTEGGIHGVGGSWDRLDVTSVPDGWVGTNSPEQVNPLHVKITAPPDAENGLYEMGVQALNRGDKEKIGGAVNFSLLVEVSREVLEVSVTPERMEVGAGQPARYMVTIRNTGAASDVFKIYSRGVPLWDFEKRVFVPSKSEKTVAYEVVSEEEQELEVRVTVSSDSSYLLSETKKVVLKANTSLFSDYAACGHGVLLYPVIQGPVYALIGLLANLF